MESAVIEICPLTAKNPVRKIEISKIFFIVSNSKLSYVKEFLVHKSGDPVKVLRPPVQTKQAIFY